ncbi:MAG: AI-2E family transporter YdiK [Desulfuromonadales bacterium]|nr:AI-2E family transporter YdiK [Desulfuromonadales bacterium]
MRQAICPDEFIGQGAAHILAGFFCRSGPFCIILAVMIDPPPQTARGELIRNTVVIFMVSAMAASCLWILRPFLPALVWSATIVIATWPLMSRIQTEFGGRRRAAVAVMIGLLLLVFVIPFALAVGTIVDNAPKIAAFGKQLSALGIPTPPEWLGSLPLIGQSLHDSWQTIAAENPEALALRVTPYARDFGGWLVAQAGSFGLMFIHILLTLLLSAILFLHGEQAADTVRRFAFRIAGARGENAAVLAGLATRAVALGVVVTALVQSLLAGLGLLVVGIPYASLLTALIFMLTIAQIGAGPVLLPVVGWLFWTGNIGWGVAMLIWSVLVMALDNVLRPLLIRRSANLPLLLVFAGVIGGLLAFGLIGLFIGPVLLAVSYTLLQAWISEEE